MRWTRATWTLGVLLVAGSAHAQSGGSVPDPVWVPPSPPASGCPAPTLAQCSDPDWLYSDDPCAVEQNAPGSECAGLFYEDLDTRASNGDEELHVVSTNLVPLGVSNVIPTPVQSYSLEKQYVPDLYSITSQKGGIDYVGANDLAANIYAFWHNNGTRVESCREYVYERFYDINEFQRRIKGRRDDYRRVFADAYGPAYNHWAVGSRHLNDSWLRGKDGKPFGRIFNNISRAKNAFFSIPQYPGINNQAGVLDGPPLLSSLSKFDPATSARIAKIQAKKTNNAHMVAKTWAWNKQMEGLLAYHPGVQGGGGGFNQQLLYAPQPDPEDVVLNELGNLAQYPNVRRRLYEELDELYELQLRLRRLQEEWAKANLRFLGSGWTVTNAGLEKTQVNLVQFQAPQQNQGFGLQANNYQQQPPAQQGLNFAIENPETVVRRRILEELVEVIARADLEGCLESWPSACDWSPREFTERILFDFGPQEDELYAWCQDFSGGQLSNLLNLNIVFVEHPQFYCKVQTGPTLTAAQLEALVGQVETCREAEIAYKEWMQLEEAKNRVKSIPELYDQSTGQFKLPGIYKSRDEYMGNKYFGLGYDYAFGFNLDIQSEICVINLYAGGHLKSEVNLLTLPVSLIDAAAYVDTEAREVRVHASVLGIELFDGIHETWSTQEDFHFNVVKTPKKSKDQTLIDTKIIVVVVPIGIKLGITGEVGANLGATLDTAGLGGDACPEVIVGGLVEPFIGMGGYVSAAIDIFIAAAGVRGEVNIITVSLPFRPGIGLKVLGGMPGSVLPSGIEFQLSAKLDLRLSTLSGRIFAFAEIGWCPFCYTGEFTIVEWTGPQWNTSIINQTYKVNLADLDVAFNGG